MIQAMEHLPLDIGASLDLAGFWPKDLRKQAMELKGWQFVQDHGVLSREEVNHLLARNTSRFWCLYNQNPFI
jgi:hypothetical protein